MHLRWRSLLAAGALAALAAAGTWWNLSARTGPHSGPIALAVLPLTNLSGDAGQEYFSDGMTEEITGKLSHLSGLVVASRGGVAKYKGAKKDPREIGKELGVSHLVEGSVRRVGDRIRVNVTLVKTDDTFQVWSDSIEARVDDIFDVQERVARRIVEALHVRLSPDESGSLGRWGTRNAAAYDEYLRGFALVERHNRRENVDAGRARFERALEMDPDFAPAMAGLAFVEAALYRDFDSDPAHLARARELLDRALALDPLVPRALHTSGIVRAASYDYRGATEDFRRAAALEPRSYLAWDGVCWMLGYVTPPELDEGERACRRSLELNPGYAEAEYHLVRILALAGRSAEAEQVDARLAERAPGSPFSGSARFWIELSSSRPRAAIEALERQPRFVAATAVGSAWLAMAHAQAGDLDRAFGLLEDALKKGFRDIDGLQGGREFEPLRRDPRFAALLARYEITLAASAGRR